MIVKLKTQLLIVFLGLSLSACATTQPPSTAGSINFGTAVRANIAAHAVPVSQSDKSNTHIPANRKRQAAALKRYEEGEVIEPKSTNTLGGSN